MEIRQTNPSIPSSDMEKGSIEKDNGSNSSRPSTATSLALTLLNADSPIIYHYLTFATPLPSPTTTSLSSTDSPPPEPNLSKFQDPFTWSPMRKRLTVWLSCLATLFTAYNAGSYSPPMSAMASEYGVSDFAMLTGITSFCIGFAIMPMVLAPFSELQGRYPVFVWAGVFFEAFQIACALAPNLASMIIFRFVVGCGSSVFSSMVGGVISDLYHSHERNTSMALFSGGALFGTGLGPIVAGVITQHLQWRWVFWVQSITNGLLILAIIVFFKESRGSVLLSRKAAALNKWYEEREAAGFVGVEMPNPDGEGAIAQRIRWKVKTDEERETVVKMIQISVWRPIHLLFTEPVVFFFSLWVSFAWAVLYMTFASLPLIFSVSHSFNTEQCGAVFTAMCIGAAIATYLAIAQEPYSARLGHFLGRFTGRHKRHDAPVLTETTETRVETGEKGDEEEVTVPVKKPYDPEIRLYFSCFHSFLLPLGLFILGGTQFSHIPWVIPCIGISLATMGIYSVYLATFNYLADVYHRYASSALAAQSFCRNVMGAVFPLISGPMFRNLGFAQAASVLGAIGVVLTAVPWVLVAYGPMIRARSKFASEQM